jgi:hypothetical protein
MSAVDKISKAGSAGPGMLGSDTSIQSWQGGIFSIWTSTFHLSESTDRSLGSLGSLYMVSHWDMQAIRNMKAGLEYTLENASEDQLQQGSRGSSYLSEPVPYPGREEVWPGLGIYIHPVVQQVPGWIGRGRGAD